MEETCHNLFILGRERLKEVGISGSARESKKILAFLTNNKYSDLNWINEFKISKELSFKFNNLIEQRVSGKPISKIIGKKLFFNSGFTDIKVTKDFDHINRVVSGRLLP